MIAAQHGQTPCLEALIKAGANINAATQQGLTPLMIAARFGKKECLEALIKDGAIIDAATQQGTTALMSAAASGYTPCLEALIKAGANINAATQQGGTALMAAARCGKKLCLEALIKASANVNKATQQGGTALMLAAQYGKTPCLEALIKAGACLDTQSNTGKTAAEWAANFPHIQNLLKKEREERERITKLADTHCEKIKYIIQYPMKFRMLGFPKTDYVTPGDFKTILTQLNRLKTWRPMQLISRACAPFLDKTLETSEHEPPIENTAPQQEQTPTPKKAKNMKGNQSKQNYPLFQTMRTNQRRLEAYLQEPLKIDNYAELFAWSNLCHIIPKSMDLTPAPTGLKLGLLQNTQQATHTAGPSSLMPR